MSSIAEIFLTGVAQHRAGHLAEAEDLYRRVLRRDPSHADALHLLGVAAHQQGRHEAAIDLIGQAIALNATTGVYFSNLGAAQKAFGTLSAAENSYRRSIEILPSYAEAHYNLGNVLLEQARASEAIDAFERAVELKPDLADAQHNLATAQRMIGDFGHGWDGYEWRFRCDIQERTLPWPLWDGTSLADKNLLVHAEQGVGDEVMFASCLPDVVESARRCVFECDRRLAPLFARSIPGVSVVARRDDFRLTRQDLPFPVDCHLPAGSLPKFFRRNEQAFPRRKSFLQADQLMVDVWRRRLSAIGPETKIGVAWRGGKSKDIRARRSTDLSQWKPILSIANANFISLQYDDTADEWMHACAEYGLQFHDWDGFNRRENLDDLAALISALDLVISVDNFTVHFAGALGTRTWVLLPYVPDWRWMLNRNDSPWYTSVRLYRQSRPGEWSEPIEKVAAALQLQSG